MGHYNQNRQKVKNRFTACYSEQSDDCGRKLKEWRMVKSDGSAEVQCALLQEVWFREPSRLCFLI